MGPSKQHTSETQLDTQEISIFEIFEILQHRLWELLAVIFTVPCLAVFLTLTVDQTYEATALIRIAQIGESRPAPNSSDYVIYSRPIEHLDNILFRIKSAAFSENLNRSLGFQAKVDAEKAGSLISLSAKARTREEAIATISAAIELLAMSHNKLMEEILSILDNELKSVKEELDLAKHSLRKIVESNSKKTGPAGDENLASYSLENFRMEIVTKLRNRRTELETALSQQKAWPTGLVDSVTAPLGPTYPNRPLVLKISLAVGIVLGILTCLFREGWSRRRKSTGADVRDLS